jgi:hypothetical protein
LRIGYDVWLMIETIEDLKRFQLENQQGDWIVHAIPMADHHPAICIPSILFIRNILTGKTYYYAFNHPDSKPSFHSSFDEIIRNFPNRKWALDKKAFEQIFWKSPTILDANALSWMRHNEIFELSEYETAAHYLVRKNATGHDGVNLVIPLMKHKELFDELATDLAELVNGYEPDSAFTQFNNLIIGTLGELEQQGICVNRTLFRERYKQDPAMEDIVYSQYNVYTSTGRPSNSYKGVNYAALNQSDGTRKCFRSRYGDDGCIVVLDYTAFHPRIVGHLVKYNVPIDTNIYAYLAKHYFHKAEVDETDIINSKKLTFRQFYGGIEDKYLHIKYLSNIKKFTEEHWELFESRGYVETPFFKRRITSKHISDPDPPKVFNYLLQGVEGELAIPKVKEVMNHLGNKKTKAILYVYDSIILDFYKKDGVDILKEIKQIMSFGGRFPVKIYIGETYDDVQLTNL